MSDQTVRIIGRLDLVTTDNNTSNKGEIRFTGEFGSDYGKLRSIGYRGFGNLMLDCANLQQGLAIRTALNQDGGDGAPGPYAPYALAVVNSGLAAPGCKMRALLVDDSDFTYGGKLGSAIFQVKRMSTESMTSTNLQSCIGSFTQNSFRAGESIMMNLGFQPTSANGGLGFYTPTGNQSDSDNRLFLGMYNSSTGKTPKTLSVTPSGNVEIPNTLTAGTVNATTYIGLPVQSVEPLTLDDTNDRVGINQVTPTEALDVTGNILASGTVTADTVSATTYIGLPTQSVEPLTLDDTNDRVGINKTVPTSTLDVVGSTYLDGATTVNDTFVVQKDLGMSTLLGMTCNPTTGVTNVIDLVATGSVTADTVSATTYVGLPAFDPAVLDPITPDSVNNRVGINQATPTEALDVTGNIVATGSVTGATLGGTLTTAAQTNITSVGTLSSLGVTGTMTAGTVSATTYVGLPTPSVLPITLDTANNRVGINQSTPSFTLDVSGSVRSTGTIQCSMGFQTNSITIKANTGTPEGTQTAPVGSLFLRTDGASGTTLYTKESGTGNTGWSTIGGTPQIGSIVASEALSADIVQSINTTYTVFTFTLPYVGRYEMQLSFRYSSSSGEFTFGWSNVFNSGSLTSVYPDQERCAFASGSAHPQYVSSIYTVATPGTRYLLARFISGTGTKTLLSDETCFVARYLGNF